MTLAFKTRLYSRIENNSDDAYQSGTTVDISSLNLSHFQAGDLIGFRFEGIKIPRGATITSAVLRVWIGAGNDDPNLQIHCQKAGNPSTFTTADDNIGGRALTDEYGDWVASNIDNNEPVFSPDFSSAVQEVVDLPEWASGNSLIVILKSNATTSFSIRSRDNSVFQRVTLIIEYTRPAPMRPTIHSVYQTTLRNTTSRSLSVSIPTAGGTRLYAFVHSARIAADNAAASHVISSATLHGAAMTELGTQSASILNIGHHRVTLYEVIDPLDDGSNPSSQTLEIVFSKSVLAVGITVAIVTGVTERGDVVKEGDTPQVPDIAIDVEADRYPGLVLAGGHMRRKGTSLDALHATDDGGALSQYSTGTAEHDLNVFFGGATVAEADTYQIGWNWTTVDWSPSGSNALLMGVPIYGTVEVAEAEFSGVDPVVVYGDATMDGLMADAEFSGIDPVVIVGSIPPVQVSGRGPLFLSTSSRSLTVCLLATNGDDWVITDGGGDVEQLSLRIKRRVGYLTPV